MSCRRQHRTRIQGSPPGPAGRRQRWAPRVRRHQASGGSPPAEGCGQPPEAKSIGTGPTRGNGGGEQDGLAQTSRGVLCHNSQGGSPRGSPEPQQHTSDSSSWRQQPTDMAEAAATENRRATSLRGKVWSRGSSWSGPFGLLGYLGPLLWLFHHKWQAGGLPTCPTAAAVRRVADMSP